MSGEEKSQAPLTNFGLPRKAPQPPPVYRPQDQAMQLKSAAPAVYRPQAGATQLKQAAPPVYRPQPQATQLKPAAPPVYRPQAAATQLKAAAPPPVYRPQPQASQAKPAALPAYQPRPRQTQAIPIAPQAAVQAKPLGSVLQPKPSMRSSAPATASQFPSLRPQAAIGRVAGGAASRQAARGGSRTLQAMMGPTASEMLTQLAQPRTFPGPEVVAQAEIAEELEALFQTDEYPRGLGMKLDLICLGGIQLPEDLSVGKEELTRNARLTDIPNPSITSNYSFVENRGELKAKVVRNTISTMITAGQIAYLDRSGLTRGEWTVWVEVHYYRTRAKVKPYLHKDTLGETLFVNLNYITNHEIAGPEFVKNPLPVPEHDRRIGRSLPPAFLEHLDAARRDLPLPTEITASTIPANGVVSFVDEMIHHMTPLYGHRKVTAAKLATFLQTKYAARYAKALADYGAYQKTTNAWGVAATVGSWIGSLFSDPVEEGRKWYRWIGMTKTTSKFDRVELAKSGLSPADVEELVDEYSEFASGFGGVSIPGSDRAPVRAPDTPRLTRQMSSKALAKTIPPPVTGDRRFFRTWVRAVRR